MQDMTTDIQAVIEGLKNGKRVRCVCDERSDTPRVLEVLENGKKLRIRPVRAQDETIDLTPSTAFSIYDAL